MKNDNFDVGNEYSVDFILSKICWDCETKHMSGHMVWDATKTRNIFLCENCFNKLKN
ncbi:MAG: hypothetical protein ACFFG0_42770 [Candidatus Thorarchaeota archaeon]